MAVGPRMPHEPASRVPRFRRGIRHIWIGPASFAQGPTVGATRPGCQSATADRQGMSGAALGSVVELHQSSLRNVLEDYRGPLARSRVEWVVRAIRGADDQGKPRATGLEFIDTGFENASPLWYEAAPDGTILLYLMYDHERNSPNRAAGHFHFRIHAKAGSVLTLEFKNLDNVWNGRRASVADELKAAVVSSDGREWRPVALKRLAGDRVQLTVTMPGPELYVARAEPYRLSDLDAWLASIRPNPLVSITPIGKTVEGRPLEIVRVGVPEAP